MTRSAYDDRAAFLSALRGKLAPIGQHPDTPSASRRYTPAAVLVPVIGDGRSLNLVLTVRAAHLKTHPGQISFPGGHVETIDSDVGATARRETVEELGITATAITALGCLPPCITGTGYRVLPVVGILDQGIRYEPDLDEVDEVFHVPLAYFRDPKVRTVETRRLRGRMVDFYVFSYEQRRIWGATARMIADLLAALDNVPDKLLERRLRTQFPHRE